MSVLSKKFKLPVLIGLASSISAFALAQETPDAPTPEEEARELDKVVVTGIRASLDQALGAKRNSDKVVDVISSEDIGKFPDENLAESLQRVTGVSISRQDGEGSRVSVRGLAPELTKVTLNGQSVSSATGGRDFDFQVISSDLVGAIEVIKSPTADIDEGGVGGTVNIKTPKPLDIGEFKSVASIKANYDELSGEVTPRGSFLISNVFGDQDQFGFLASVSYQARELRRDGIEVTYDQEGPGEFNPADNVQGGVDIDGLTVNPVTIRNIQTAYQAQDRERLGFNTAFQWRPTPNLELYADTAYTTLDNQTIEANAPYRLFTSRTRQGNFAFDNVTQSGLTVVSADVNDPRVRMRTFSSDVSQETLVLSAGVEWIDDADLWTISTDFSFTEAEREEESFFVSFEQRHGVSYDLNGGADDPTSLVIAPTVDVTDASLFPFDRFQGRPIQIMDDEFAAQIDFERRLELGAFNTVKFGAKIKERSNEVESTEEQIRGLTVDFASIAAPFPVDDFLSGFGGIPTTFAYADPFAARAAVIAANGGQEPVFDIQPLESGDVVEESTAFYVMTNFGNEEAAIPYRGNIGVRYVETDMETNGAQFIGGVFVPTTQENSYTDVLPSFNVNFDLRDDLLLRLAAAKVMTRPTLSDLRLSRVINEAQLNATETNPELDPFRATQFDVSLEWYFAPSSLLSATYFYKDIESFITSELEQGVDLGLDVTGPISSVPDGINDLFDVTRVVNGEGATLQGLELSYQQPFVFLPAPFDDFGAILNYTYADSETNLVDRVTGEVLPLPGQSENTTNIVVYYENDTFNARLSYNYRDDFVVEPDGAINQPDRSIDFGQFDFSMGYNVNENLSLSFEAINLNNEKVVHYNGDPVRLRTYEETGARYFIGARYNF